jgi:hypothetical protein
VYWTWVVSNCCEEGDVYKKLREIARGDAGSEVAYSSLVALALA